MKTIKLLILIALTLMAVSAAANATILRGTVTGQTDPVTYFAYFSGADNQILTEDSYNCGAGTNGGYIDSTDTWKIQTDNFAPAPPTGTGGATLKVVLTDSANNYGSYSGVIPNDLTDVGATPLTAGALAKPTLTAAAGNNQVLLTWTSTSGQYYNIYRADLPSGAGNSASNGRYNKITTGPVTGSGASTRYIDTTAQNGNTYWYIIIASDNATFLNGKFSPHSNEVMVTPTSGSPAFPVITSLSTSSGPVGTSVTITGSNFGATQGTSTVKFNGVAAIASAWNGTTINATVPATAATGPVSVTVNGNVSNTDKMFTVIAGDITPPMITNVQATAVTSTKETISWNTDENTNPNKVSYWKAGMNTVEVTASYGTTHWVTLTNLLASTTYNYKVMSADPSGNVSTVEGLSFTTIGGPTPPPTPTNVTSGTGEARSHPNPFDPTKEKAKIYFKVDEPEVRFILYDMRGRALLSRVLTSATGDYKFEWDGQSDFGRAVANGPYVYLITAGGKVLAKGQLLVWR